MFGKAYITDFKVVADLLHKCDLDAYSYPVGRGPRNTSGLDWDEFRERIAKNLLERVKIYYERRG